MKFILITIIVIAVVGLLCFVSKNAKDWKKLILAKDVETLGMKEIISFFKSAEIMAKLKENSNNIAVAIKEEKETSTKIIACLFDKEKNTLLDTKFASAWNTKFIEDDLNDAFGGKDMIVLQ